MVPRRDLSARLVRRRELSPTAYSVTFALDGTFPPPEAGQFVMLDTPGRERPFWRRAFSPASFRDGELELMIREVGPGTAYWRTAPPGTPARVLGPLGRGFGIGPGGGRIAAVAGGIGLPPLLMALEEAARHGRRADLLQGAATADELLEPERCAAAARMAGGEFVAATDDGTAGEEGLVTEALERRLDVRGYGLVLACGPLPMLRALARICGERRIEGRFAMEERMACGVGVCLGCVVPRAGGGHARVCADGPVFGAQDLDWEAMR